MLGRHAYDTFGEAAPATLVRDLVASSLVCFRIPPAKMCGVTTALKRTAMTLQTRLLIARVDSTA